MCYRHTLCVCLKKNNFLWNSRSVEIVFSYFLLEAQNWISLQMRKWICFFQIKMLTKFIICGSKVWNLFLKGIVGRECLVSGWRDNAKVRGNPVAWQEANNGRLMQGYTVNQLLFQREEKSIEWQVPPPTPGLFYYSAGKESPARIILRIGSRYLLCFPAISPILHTAWLNK